MSDPEPDRASEPGTAAGGATRGDGAAQADSKPAVADAAKAGAAVPESGAAAAAGAIGDQNDAAASEPSVARAEADPGRAAPPSAVTTDPGAADTDGATRATGAASTAERAIAADLAEAEAMAAAEDDDRTAGDEPHEGRRRPLAAVGLLAVAAGLLWASSRMTWVTLHVTREDMGVGRTVHLSGSTWFGALTPVALVLLATIAAVFATRGWARRLVGVVVAVLAAVAAVPAFWLLQHRGNTVERAAQLAELRVFEHGGGVDVAVLPEWLSLLGALAAFVAGLLLVRMPADSARMSGKYDNPAARKSAATAQVAQHHAGQRDAEAGSQTAATGRMSGRVLWDALDEGVDPTDDETNDPAAHDDPGSGESHDQRH